MAATATRSVAGVFPSRPPGARGAYGPGQISTDAIRSPVLKVTPVNESPPLKFGAPNLGPIISPLESKNLMSTPLSTSEKTTPTPDTVAGTSVPGTVNEILRVLQTANPSDT